MDKYDAKSRCPKCGGETYDKWECEVEENAAVRAAGGGYLMFPHPEQMERKCRRCAYVWHEAPLDA